MTQTQVPVARETFARAGSAVRAGLRLGQAVPRKPAGVTGGQWNAAAGAHLDFLVDDGAAPFAVQIGPPTGSGTPAARVDRLTNAVCDAAGFGAAAHRVDDAAGRGARPADRRVRRGRPRLGRLDHRRRPRPAVPRHPRPAPGRPHRLRQRPRRGRAGGGRRGVRRTAARRPDHPHAARAVDRRPRRGLGLAGGRAGRARLRAGTGRGAPHVRRHRPGPPRRGPRHGGDRRAVEDAPLRRRWRLVDRAHLAAALDGLRARRDDLDGGFAFDHLTFED